MGIRWGQVLAPSAAIGIAVCVGTVLGRDHGVSRQIAQLPLGVGAHVDPTDWDGDGGSTSTLAARVAGGSRFADRHWRAALERSAVIHHRARWPATDDFAISMIKPRWLGSDMRVRATLFGADSRTATAGIWNWPAFWCLNGYADAVEGQRCQRLARLAPGMHDLRFDVVVERAGASEDDPPDVLWSGILESRVEIVEKADDAIAPVTGMELDRAVRAALSIELKADAESPSLFLKPDVTAFPVLDGTGLSLDIEVLDRGEVVETFELDELNYVATFTHGHSSEKGRAWRHVGMTSIPRSAVEESSSSASRWSVRVRGTNRNLLGLLWVERYWAGTVELSLVDGLAGERGAGPR